VFADYKKEQAVRGQIINQEWSLKNKRTKEQVQNLDADNFKLKKQLEDRAAVHSQVEGDVELKNLSSKLAEENKQVEKEKLAV